MTDKKQRTSDQEECARRVTNKYAKRQKSRGTPVLLGLERTTSIEGTLDRGSCTFVGFTIIGASGGPGKQDSAHISA